MFWRLEQRQQVERRRVSHHGGGLRLEAPQHAGLLPLENGGGVRPSRVVRQGERDRAWFGCQGRRALLLLLKRRQDEENAELLIKKKTIIIL